jgi:hypothetical protein
MYRLSKVEWQESSNYDSLLVNDMARGSRRVFEVWKEKNTQNFINVGRFVPRCY